MFQSSPSPKAGSYLEGELLLADANTVPILSQPEGWKLQPIVYIVAAEASPVPILSQPEGWKLRS